jgi:hypothetical protein
MDAIAESVPNAAAVEGTTIYCTAAGADGAYEALSTTQGVVTITLSDDGADIQSGTLTVTVANTTAGTSATTAALNEATMVDAADNAADNVSIHHEIDALANVDAATTVVSADGAGDTQVITLTFPANTGTWAVTCVSTLSAHASNADGSVTCTVGGVAGVPATTYDFIDDDLSTNTIMTLKTTNGSSAVGAGSTIRSYYQTWAYDSTDQFGLDAGGDNVATTVLGATEAQFEAANAALTALTTDMTITYRTGALTTGISYFVTGT